MRKKKCKTILLYLPALLRPMADLRSGPPTTLTCRRYPSPSWVRPCRANNELRKCQIYGTSSCRTGIKINISELEPESQFHLCVELKFCWFLKRKDENRELTRAQLVVPSTSSSQDLLETGFSVSFMCGIRIENFLIYFFNPNPRFFIKTKELAQHWFWVFIMLLI